MTGYGPDFDTDDAACKGVDMEFPEHAGRRNLAPELQRRASELKAICLRCPLIEDCRAWAIDNVDNAFGHVAGGLTPAERRRRRVSAKGSAA